MKASVRPASEAAKLAALYAAAALVWIMGSDSAVAWLVPDAETLAAVQGVKGTVFVLFTCSLLYLWSRRAFQRLALLLGRISTSESTYAALVEAQPNPVLRLTRDGVISLCNPAAKALGCSAGDRLAAIVGGDEAAVFAAAMAGLTSAQPAVTLESRRGEGWLSWQVRAVFAADGTLAHFHLSGQDITRQRRTEADLRATQHLLERAVEDRTRALEESRGRFQDFAEVASDWMWEADQGGRFTYLSALFPFADAEQGTDMFLGMSLAMAPPFRARDGLDEANERLAGCLLGREPFRDIERQVAGPDGELRFYRIKGKPVFDAAGEFKGWRGAGIDITERKRALLALHSMHEDLERRVLERTAELEAQVAERRRAKSALAKDRALLRCLIDAIPDLIFFKDADSVYLGGNKAFCAYAGLTEAELIGRTDHDFFSPEVAEFYRDKDRAMFAAGTPRSNEEWITYPDGRHVLLDTVKTPYWGPQGELLGLVGIGRDVTARKLAEDRFRELVEDVDAIAWEYDFAEQRFVYVSPQAEIITGYPQQAWFEPGFWPAHIHPDDREAAIDNCTLASRRGEDHALEYRMIKADGGLLWLRDIVHVHMEEGQPTILRGLMIDISERKRAEAKMIQASKLVTLGEMAAGMAHELSQPLHIIRLAADGRIMDLDDGRNDLPDTRKCLELVSAQTQRMAEIIDHTRIFSRQEDEHAAVVFDGWEAVDSAIRLVRQQIEADGIAVHWTRPDEIAPVNGNAVQLEQVVMNIVANARDAIRAHDGSGPRWITVAGSCVDDSLRLTVSDTGGGFPPEVLRRAFEPFFTTKPPGAGTGLGLSVSMHIVDRMKGAIEAANVGPGAQVTVTMPLAEDAIPRTASSVARRERWVPRRSGHVLLVDDEPLAVETMAKILAGTGLRVSRARDGEEALACFAADPADVVVTDARMPRCDGAELIRRLHDRAPGLPVIVVSGQGDAEASIRQGRRAGEAVHLFKKPVDIAELRRAIVELLPPPEDESGTA